ncbi:MAG: class IV adenylate cyclase [Acidobacteriota bacterium]
MPLANVLDFNYMPIEIEKKYRLTESQRELLPGRLQAIGAQFEGEDFEENTLFKGATLEAGRAALRLRRVGGRAILTYKERLPSTSGTKHQREEETVVSDPERMHAILTSLGFSPAVVYEKRRQTWRLRDAEIVVDELPFGLFMEIEGSEEEISDIEGALNIEGLATEVATYPQLALRFGTPRDTIVEARFADS